MIYEFMCKECNKITSLDKPINDSKPIIKPECEHCGQTTHRIWTTGLQTENLKREH